MKNVDKYEENIYYHLSDESPSEKIGKKRKKLNRSNDDLYDKSTMQENGTDEQDLSTSFSDKLLSIHKNLDESESEIENEVEYSKLRNKKLSFCNMSIIELETRAENDEDAKMRMNKTLIEKLLKQTLKHVKPGNSSIFSQLRNLDYEQIADEVGEELTPESCQRLLRNLIEIRASTKSLYQVLQETKLALLRSPTSTTFGRFFSFHSKKIDKMKRDGNRKSKIKIGSDMWNELTDFEKMSYRNTNCVWKTPFDLFVDSKRKADKSVKISEMRRVWKECLPIEAKAKFIKEFAIMMMNREEEEKEKGTPISNNDIMGPVKKDILPYLEFEGLPENPTKSCHIYYLKESGVLEADNISLCVTEAAKRFSALNSREKHFWKTKHSVELANYNKECELWLAESDPATVYLHKSYYAKPNAPDAEMRELNKKYLKVNKMNGQSSFDLFLSYLKEKDSKLLVKHARLKWAQLNKEIKIKFMRKSAKIMKEILEERTEKDVENKKLKGPTKGDVAFYLDYYKIPKKPYKLASLYYYYEEGCVDQEHDRTFLVKANKKFYELSKEKRSEWAVKHRQAKKEYEKSLENWIENQDGVTLFIYKISLDLLQLEKKHDAVNSSAKKKQKDLLQLEKKHDAVNSSAKKKQKVKIDQLRKIEMPINKIKFSDEPLVPPLSPAVLFAKEVKKYTDKKLNAQMSKKKFSRLDKLSQVTFVKKIEKIREVYINGLLDFVDKMVVEQRNLFLGLKRIRYMRLLGQDIFEEKYPNEVYPVYIKPEEEKEVLMHDFDDQTDDEDSFYEEMEEKEEEEVLRSFYEEMEEKEEEEDEEPSLAPPKKKSKM